MERFEIDVGKIVSRIGYLIGWKIFKRECLKDRRISRIFEGAGYSSELSNESWRVSTFKQRRKYTDDTVVGIFVEQLLIRGENARAMIYSSREGFPKKKGEKKGRRKEIFPHPILDQTLSNVLKQSNNYN